LLWKWL
jgi:hypothetical protein